MCRGKELVYGGVSFSYLLCLLGSTRSSAILDICLRWLSRHEDGFLARYQVLHLHYQVCVQRYAVQPVLLVPLEYVLVF